MARSARFLRCEFGGTRWNDVLLSSNAVLSSDGILLSMTHTSGAVPDLANVWCRFSHAVVRTCAVRFFTACAMIQLES